jgi:hypothetical protein
MAEIGAIPEVFLLHLIVQSFESFQNRIGIMFVFESFPAAVRRRP